MVINKLKKEDKPEHKDCKYSPGTCEQDVPKEPTLCLECMASSLNNTVYLFGELLKHATVPFPVGYAITVEFMHFANVNEGLKKWFMENSRSEIRKQSIREMVKENERLLAFLQSPDQKVGIV